MACFRFYKILKQIFGRLIQITLNKPPDFFIIFLVKLIYKVIKSFKSHFKHRFIDN